VQQRATYITGGQRELKWALRQPREHPIDITEEPLGEPSALRLVQRGILEIGLGKWPNDEPADHCDLLPAVDLLAQTFLNSLPGVTRIWVRFQISQAFVENFPVPIRNRIDSGLAAIQSHSDCR
jgi:hypothetical protein